MSEDKSQVWKDALVECVEKRKNLEDVLKKSRERYVNELRKRQNLEEQLEAAQRELREYEERCHRCDSSIGIQQAREIGRENWCCVCWDTPIIRRRASTPASAPLEQEGGTDA